MVVMKTQNTILMNAEYREMADFINILTDIRNEKYPKIVQFHAETEQFKNDSYQNKLGAEQAAINATQKAEDASASAILAGQYKDSIEQTALDATGYATKALAAQQQCEAIADFPSMNTAGAGGGSIYVSNASISENVTITSSQNAMSIGPVTVQDGVTVTATGTWTII